MAYIPRTARPSDYDDRWTNYQYGGVNRCVLGSPQPWSGSVLANCTGYVHGRWMELGNTYSEYNLSFGNANTYYGHSDSYERGSEPKLGAILCLGGGSYGHVAVVEEILSNGDIMCSESNYGSTVFEYVQRYRSTGYMRRGGSVGGFQGFIYHPSITPSQPVYHVTVVGGTASPSSGHAGDVLGLTANVPNGYKFVRWTVSGAGTVTSPTLANTTFTVGDGDATVTAVLAKKSSGMNLMFYISPPVYRRH